jgi:hypothetical protein
MKAGVLLIRSSIHDPSLSPFAFALSPGTIGAA